ncbi:MAG: hypothetical protein Q7U88_16565 [Desulfocapsaceae bacterium]|nr:hypothetical protein [Desulfocapsaceae bacterium]
MKPNQIQRCEEFDKVTTVEALTTLRLLGIKSASYNTMLNELPVYLWIHDDRQKIVYGNRAFIENFPTCLQQPCHQCLMGEESPCSCCPSEKFQGNKTPERCNLCKRGKSGYDINIIHKPITHQNGEKFIFHSSRHITDLSILADNLYPEKQNTNEEQKFLIMCAACKRARDENNNWVTIDTHILNVFPDRISHGICPDCVRGLYPWMEDEAGPASRHHNN